MAGLLLFNVCLRFHPIAELFKGSVLGVFVYAGSDAPNLLIVDAGFFRAGRQVCGFQCQADLFEI